MCPFRALGAAVSAFGWTVAGAFAVLFAVLPLIAVAWRIELAVRVRWRMRMLRREGVL
jgi:hypothetical protein